MTAQLYFLNEAGELVPEERTLSLYEGDTQVSAVIRALENGPEAVSYTHLDVYKRQPTHFLIKRFLPKSQGRTAGNSC